MSFLLFIMGLCLARWNMELAGGIGMVLFIGAIIICRVLKESWRCSIIVILCIGLGIVRIALLQSEETWTEQLIETKRFTCVGEVHKITTKDEDIQITINHISISGINSIPVNHFLILTLSKDFRISGIASDLNNHSNHLNNQNFYKADNLKIGQIVSVIGEFSFYPVATNMGQFDYAAYYRSIHVYGQVEVKNLTMVDSSYYGYFNKLYQLKCKLTAVIEQLAEEEDVGIFKAILLGDKTSLTTEIKDLYQRNGISHILAVSGLHISLFGVGLYQVLCRLLGNRLVSGVCSAFFIVNYCLMIGGSIGAVRATISFVLFLVAQVLGRKQDGLITLAISGFVLLWQYPLALWQSGFQLSFAALAGVHIVSPCMQLYIGQGIPFVFDKRCILQKYIEIRKQIFMALVLGIAVQLALMPIILWHQYVWPLYGVLLNVVLVPLMGLVLISAAGCAGLGAVFPQAGIFMTGIGHYVLQFYQWVCENTQKLPYALFVRGRPEIWQVILWMGIMIIMVIGMMRIKDKYKIFYSRGLPKKFWRREPAASIIIQQEREVIYEIRMFILLVIFFGSILWMHHMNSSELVISYLDIGQGDAIICQLPDGQVVGIDAGSSSKTNAGKQIVEPFLLCNGITKVNHWIITHPDSDHYSAILELIERQYPIQHIWMAQVFQEDDFVKELEQLHSVEWLHQGQVLQIDDVKLEILHPQYDINTDTTDANDLSVVTLLTYGQTKALFTGDMGFDAEENVLAALKGYKIDILKVAHHGSKNSTSLEFLQKISPKMSVISCGKNNRYGHPEEEVLLHLQEAGSKILRTDKIGMIQIALNLKAIVFLRSMC